MRLVFGTILALVSATTAATTAPRSLAWEEPGFVMDELIVTAPRAASPNDLAVQKPELVIDRVVPTVPSTILAVPESVSSEARLEELVEIHRRHISRM